jgi:hypothetical protein
MVLLQKLSSGKEETVNGWSFSSEKDL